MTAADYSFRPALKLMGGRLVGSAATFFVPIVLVRLFAPEVFGTYKQLFLVYGTLYGLAQLGMAESLFYFLPQDPARRGQYASNALLVLGLSGLVVLAVLWRHDVLLAGWLRNPALQGLLPLVGALLLGTLASSGLEIGLMCQERYGAATISYVLSDVARALFLVVPALLFGTVRAVLVGAVVFAMCRLAVHLTLLLREDGASLRPDRALLGRQLAYCLPFQLAVMVEVGQANLHQYAVASWFDTATFAIYAVGCLQIPLVELATSSAGNVMMVGMSGALEAGDRDRAIHIWRSTTRKLALLLFPLVALLLLVAHDLIPFLFTDRYRASIPIFMVWSGAVLSSVLQTDSALRVLADMRAILALHVLRLAVVVGSIGILVRLAGLPGAVLATVLAAVVAKALGLARLRRRLGSTWPELLPWPDLLRTALATSAAAVPVALLSLELERGTPATIVLLSGAYGAFLFASGLFFGVLESEAPELARRLRALWRFPRAQTR